MEYRFERKFVLPTTDLKFVETSLRMHHCLFSEIYYQRFINNIYLDSYNLRAANETLIGAAKRKKYRIRWYGDLLGNVSSPRLEIKHKNQFLVMKESFALKDFVFNGRFTREDLYKLIDESDIPPEIALQVKMQSPVLVNRYYRGYYLSADKHFRVTLDTNMKTKKIETPWQQSFFSMKEMKHMVVELKYSREFDNEAEKITQSFNFRPYKNSKYLSGMVDGNYFNSV